LGNSFCVTIPYILRLKQKKVKTMKPYAAYWLCLATSMVVDSVVVRGRRKYINGRVRRRRRRRRRWCQQPFPKRGERKVMEREEGHSEP
jgi:hypothetical protein